MSELWARLKRWVDRDIETSIAVLAGVVLFGYLWWDDGLRAAVSLLAMLAGVMLWAWLCARVWLVLLAGKRFAWPDLALLAAIIACETAVYFMFHPVLATGMPVLGMLLSLPGLILAIKLRVDSRKLSEGDD
jgi:hypothetical protein